MNCPVLFKIIMITFNGFGRMVVFVCSQNSPSLFPTLLCYSGNREVVKITDLKVCQVKMIERKVCQVKAIERK